MSNEPKAGPGVDPDMLAAYIEKKLSPEQRAAVEAQLAADPDSYAVLVESMKTLETLEAPRVPEVPKGRVLPFRRWVIAAGSLAAAAAIALSFLQPEWLRILGDRDRVDPRLERLVAAVGEERYVEARLTGGFAYGPLKTVPRGATGGGTGNLTLLAVAGEIQKASEADPSPENLHAWAIAQLLLGDYSAAISTFDAALLQRPDDASTLSDLSAALVARAQRDDRAEDWPRALDSASRAVQLSSPPLAEALFNRALAAEALGLRDVATRYWREFLDRETQGDWRSDVENRLRLLETPQQGWREQRPGALDAVLRQNVSEVKRLVASRPQQMRELLEEEVFPSWSTAVLTGVSEPSSAARLLADQIAQATKDASLLKVVEEIDSASVESLHKLASGLSEYHQGRLLYEGGRVQDSVAHFTEAQRVLAVHRNAFSEWATLHLAIAAYYRGDYAWTEQRLLEIQRRVSPQQRALRARVDWMLGLVANLRADYRQAISLYQQAAAHFAELGETENLAAVHGLIAAVLVNLGDSREAWTHALKSLKQADVSIGQRRRHTHLVSAANLATRRSLHFAALVLADEAEGHGKAWGDPLAQVEVASYRARTLAMIGQQDMAVAELAEARAGIPRVIDSQLRRRIEAEVMQTEAQVVSMADPAQGIESASRALEYFRSSSSGFRIPRLYLTRAEARMALGDWDGARLDLAEGARNFEVERKALPASGVLRLSHADDIWRLYQRLLEVEIRRGASCEQLVRVSERGRAWTAREISGDAVEAEDVLAATAHQQAAVLHYSFHPGGLLIALLKGGRCESRFLLTNEAQTAVKVSSFLRAIDSGADPTVLNARGREVFDLILAPIWSKLTEASAIIVVPDGPLHFLPFAAIPTPGGKLLIESHEIRAMPVLTMPRSVQRAGSQLSAMLSAGTDVEGLPALPSAVREVQAVAQLLENGGVRIERASTSEQFLRGLHGFNLVHFAGHALANDDDPLSSMLVIGPGQQVYARELIPTAARSVAPELVVLSACSTQAGRLFGGEGPIGLAWAFVAAGSAEVLATQWPVDDIQAYRLMHDFYENWLKRHDAAFALRAAILARFAEGPLREHPRLWAAWTVVGWPASNQAMKTGGA